MQAQAGLDRVAGVTKPEHQAIAEFLDYAGVFGELFAHDALLQSEELERLVVAAKRVELGEPDDVGEHDRAVHDVRSGRRGDGHAGTSSIEPEIVIASR